MGSETSIVSEERVVQRNSETGEWKYIPPEVLENYEAGIVASIPEKYKTAGTTWTKDPGTWWDTEWEYRINITVEEPGKVDRTDWPVDVYLTFDPPAFKYSIRVIDVSGGLAEVPSQVWNVTYFNSTHISAATVTFLVDLSTGGSKDYQIYWSTDYTDPPSYPKRILVDTTPTPNGDMYVITSQVNGWSIELPPDNGGKAQNMTLATGDEIGHTWLHFGVTRNVSLDYEGYWGTCDTNNLRYTQVGGDRYIEEKEDPLLSIYEGVIFVTYVVEKVPLYGEGKDFAYVYYTYRFYDWGLIATEKVDWILSDMLMTYYVGGWVFDQDDGVGATFDKVYTLDGITNMTMASYGAQSGTVGSSWSYNRVYDTTYNLPVIQVFRTYLTAGSHTVNIYTAGDDYYAGSWRNDDPYGRVMDPDGNWLSLTAIRGSSIDGGYAVWGDGGYYAEGVAFSFNAPVDGYYYIFVGAIDDDNEENINANMDFRVDVDGSTLDYGRVYTGYITDENDLSYLIPRDAMSIFDFYPDADVVNIEHKATIEWGTTTTDLDAIIYESDGSVLGYAVNPGSGPEEMTFTPTSQSHHTILVLRFNDTGALDLTVDVVALIGAEYDDYYGWNSTWNNTAFFHSSESRGVGYVLLDENTDSLEISEKDIIWYNDGNDSEADYIYFARELKGLNASVNDYYEIKYGIVIWSPSGTTDDERLSSFMNIRESLWNSFTIQKASVEKFPIEIRIQVLDEDAQPVSGAKIQLVNTSDSTVAYSGTTNGSGMLIINCLRQSYQFKVEISSGGRTYINDSITKDYSTYDYTTFSDSVTIKFKDLIRFRLRAYTNTTPEQIIQDGRVILENTTDPSIKSEAFTNLTGWIDIYIPVGTWKLAFNATKSTPERWDNITVFSDKDLTNVVAGPSVNVTLTLSTGVTYYLVDHDITEAPVSTKLSLFNSLTFYEVYWKEIIDIRVNLTREDTDEGINGSVKWYVLNSSGLSVLSGNATKEGTGAFSLTINTTYLQGGKSYTIQINATPDSPLPDGKEPLKPSPLTIGLTVKKRLVSLDVVFDPSTSIYWNESLQITAYYSDSILNEGITGADVKVIIYASTVIEIPINEQGNGYYVKIIKDEIRGISAGSYLMVIRVSKDNYEVAEKSFTLIINKRPTSLSYTDYIEIPWTSTYVLWVQYMDERYGLPIEGATVNYILKNAITGDTVATENNLPYENGYYKVNLDLTNVEEGSYIIELFAGKKNYENKTGTITFIIRLHITIAQADATKIAVYYDENITLTINYHDEDEDEYIPGATYSCTISSAEEEGRTLTVDLTDLNNGSYRLNVKASILGRIGAYTILISLSKQHYESQNMYVSLIVKPIPTIATVSKTTEEIEWGTATTIRATFNDSRTSSGIDADVATFEITNKTWSAVYNLMKVETGVYLLSINTTNMHLAPGTYTITIHLEKWHYENKTMTISFIVSDVSVFSYAQPSNISLYWGDSDTVVVYYNMSRNNEPILNADYTLSVMDVAGTEISVPQGAFVIHEENGIYYIEIDTTKLTDGVIYILNITLSKKYYETKSILIFLKVQPIPTNVVVVPRLADITWGDNYNFTISVINLINGSGIENIGITKLIYVGGELVEIGEAIKVIELGNGEYVILVRSGLLNVTAYNIYLIMSKQHYGIENVNVTARINPILISVTIKTEKTVMKNPVTNEAQTVVEIVLREQGTNTPITGATVKIIVMLGEQKVLEVFATESSEEPGVYTATIKWTSIEPGDYTLKLSIETIQRNQYEASAENIVSIAEGTAELGVKVDYLGGSTVIGNKRYPNLLVYPPLVAILLVIGFIGYKYWSWYHLPVEVREILNLIKKIQKNIFEYESPPREEMFKEILHKSLEME